jgi:hypothetical protein
MLDFGASDVTHVLSASYPAQLVWIEELSAKQVEGVVFWIPIP